MFGWIREKVKQAVMSGFLDAMEWAEHEATCLRQDATGVLESRYRLLPAPIVLNASQDDSDMETDPIPAPSARKRGKAS